MTKKILIDNYYGVVHVAILENNVLTDYFEEFPDRRLEKGNIYCARVRRVDQTLNAAFVDYASRQEGFLSLKEIGGIKRNGRNTKALKAGDLVMTQVTRESSGHKGAALTTRISMAGRYLVFMPNYGENGVSLSLDDEERARLKTFQQKLKHPEDTGVIIRTAASGHSLRALQADLNSLLDTYSSIQNLFLKSCGPALLHQESSLILKILREHYSPEVQKILVNSKDAHDDCLDFFTKYKINSRKKLQDPGHGPLLFQKAGIDRQIDSMRQSVVKMDSGASLVIEQTEALVSIDVNSSKAKSDGNFETLAFEVNKSAAREVARQMRLRDLGGILVIDFIDMANPAHNREIESLMQSCTASDKAATDIFPIGPLGAMLISRQRITGSNKGRQRKKCNKCNGRGTRLAPWIVAPSILAKIESKLKKEKQLYTLTVKVNDYIADCLLNDNRKYLERLENENRVKIIILPKYFPEDDACAFDTSLRLRGTTTENEDQGERKTALVTITSRTPSRRRSSGSRSGKQKQSVKKSVKPAVSLKKARKPASRSSSQVKTPPRTPAKKTPRTSPGKLTAKKTSSG